jgi:hypothetical protein
LIIPAADAAWSVVPALLREFFFSASGGQHNIAFVPFWEQASERLFERICQEC